MFRSIISSHCRAGGRYIASPTLRCICSTTHLRGSWMDKVKGVLTGRKSEPEGSPGSFTLLQFAEQMRTARKLGKFKNFVVGRSSEGNFVDAFEKQEAIIRYLGGVDPTGENIGPSQKKEAAKQCSCTVADVENTLSKFTWAKAANTKMVQLKAEGKPLPKSMAEVQKLMGSTPLDVARSNLAKSGQISRNTPCPCGSRKLYKRCCGKDKSS
ncbi:hypothetical protein ACS0TY_002110 [Phlomoides rotata]